MSNIMYQSLDAGQWAVGRCIAVKVGVVVILTAVSAEVNWSCRRVSLILGHVEGTNISSVVLGDPVLHEAFVTVVVRTEAGPRIVFASD